MNGLRGRLGVLAFATCAALIALVLAGRSAGALSTIELDSVDARFSLRGAQDTPADIIIVDIDAATFEELREPWPFRRRFHARLLDELRRAGARAIAYDVQFTEPTNPKDDGLLIDAVGRADGTVVLGTTEVNTSGETAVLGGEDKLRDLGTRAASLLVPPDADGADRRVNVAEDGLETMAVATTEVATGRDVDAGEFGKDGAWIDFRGPPGTFRTVSFSRVYDRHAPAALLRDKIVVVGSSAPTLQDVHATSTTDRELMSGAEIQANAIWTVMRGVPLRSAPPWVETLLIVLLGLLPAIAGLRLGFRSALAVVVAGTLVWAAGVYVAFLLGLLLPVAYPLAALLLTTIGSLALWSARAGFERQRVRDAFSRFVPESVVSEVLAAAGDDLRLVGRRVQCSVVFIDLRGFTGWAEMLPAEDVIAVLNEYSTQFTDAVAQHGGTLVSLRGDGILAVFGAPIEQADHADRAVAAVREMASDRLEQLNAWVRERKLGDGFEIGIGVSSGVVMSGNVGSRERLQYTVIGDTANTASRLEAMTKGTPHRVLISDSTRTMLRDEATDLEYVDAVTVRGKQVKVVLWTMKVSRPKRTDAGEVTAGASQ